MESGHSRSFVTRRKFLGVAVIGGAMGLLAACGGGAAAPAATTAPAAATSAPAAGAK